MDFDQGGTNFGIMNVLSRRLGGQQSMAQEMLMVMVVPMVMRAVSRLTIFDVLRSIFKYVFQRRIVFHRRLIKCTVAGERDSSDDKEQLDVQPKNHILQKAIRLYLQATHKNDAKVQEVCLYPTKKVQLEKSMNRYGGEAEAFTGSAQQLSSYQVVAMPTESISIQLGTVRDELVFEQYIEETSLQTDSKKPYKCELIYEIRGSGTGAKDKVNGWINDAFEWYRGQRKQESVTERYMIQPSDKETDPEQAYRGPMPRTLASSAGLNYKIYPLSGDKTFDCLFFPEKAELLELLDDFLHQRKKFNVKGFPKKLGLLLDGPPGTGKTSVIKALSEYTKRHVVSISLEKIKSNQQLMDIMFELTFPVKGHEEGGLRLQMDQVIFVMEDVDCASDVVYARKGTERFRAAGQQLRAPSQATLARPEVAAQAGSSGEATLPESERGKNLRPPMAPSIALSRATTEPSKKATPMPGPLDLITRWKTPGEDSQGSDKGATTPSPAPWAGEARKLCVAAQVPFASLESLFQSWAEEHGVVTFEELAELLCSNEEALPLKSMERKRVVKEASLLSGSGSGSPRQKKAGIEEDSQGSSSSSSDEEPMFGKGKGKGKGEKKKKKKKSKKGASRPSFTMAGLLNVLDGVVDSPGRILVMTTNHPEKLDPALIRPGRINQRLHLTYMMPEQVQQMTEHYMQESMSLQQRRQLEEILRDRDITPAWVEQCCVEANNMSELIAIFIR
mmetsp:Transcript_17806/g.41505  ORF Transcript_17806/g.41505 Transcript_17806/m.41505 type:complete len:731 (+) Transcript_17806:35-2227(+)